MIGTLAAALVVTLTVKPQGIDVAKAAGMALAFIAVIPVFFFLKRALDEGELNRILGVFVGGFFFKLVIILGGVWLAVARAEMALAPFTVACLSFLFALQICEALYFWGRRSSLGKGES